MLTPRATPIVGASSGAPGLPPRPESQAHALLAPPRRWRADPRPRVRPSPALSSVIEGMGFIPGWLPWLSPAGAEGPGERERLREARRQALRQQLASARAEPPLALPPPPAQREECDAPPPDALPGSDPCCSNAVPFPHLAATASSDSGDESEDSRHVCVPRAAAVRQVLPWLYVAAGQPDGRGVQFLASSLALATLQQLDVSRYAERDGPAAAALLPDGVRWLGSAQLPTPAVAAAAALHRMAHRRGVGHASGRLAAREGGVVLVTFHPAHCPLASEVVATYLHLHCGLGLREAAQAAGNALGATPLLSTLASGLEEAACCARGWTRRVELRWPHAGGAVEAVGDAVGGWDRRVPLVFDVRLKQWRLQLWGLPPGRYLYKYLVDGCWCVDLAADTEVDAWGNVNNIVVVPGESVWEAASEAADDADGMAALPAEMEAALAAAAPPQPPRRQPAPEPAVTPEEQRRVARLGAALLALHTKLSTRRRHVLRD